MIRFEGGRHGIAECPLAWILPDEPGFDIDTTANWKGYTAEWEIKDSALYLVSFKAKKDGKEVPITTYLPGKKLPILAEWYTGRLLMPIGEPLTHEHYDWYGELFARIVVLRVEKGKVSKKEVFKNLRLKPIGEEREAERKQHHLWPFPLQEPVIVQSYGITPDWKMCIATLLPARLQSTPPWPKESADPPLSPLKAMLLAERKTREFVRGKVKHKWELEKANIRSAANDRYYYEFRFWIHPPPDDPIQRDGLFELLVLMDGTIPEPVIWEWYPWQRARRAGVFDQAEWKIDADKPPWEKRDRGVPWSELPWPARLQLLGKIVAAPKLLYEVEKLEAFVDGAWVEYSVTNGSKQRLFLSPACLHTPIWNAGFWDSKGERWHVPRPDDKVKYKEPDDLIRIEPGQKLCYRLALSFLADAPLEPLNWLHEQPPRRLAAVEYFLAAWPNAYSKLPKDRGKEKQIFAFGYGRVAVTWIDKEYPKSWPREERLNR